MNQTVEHPNPQNDRNTMASIETNFVKAYHDCMSHLSTDKALSRSSTFVLTKTPVLSVEFDTTDLPGYVGFKDYLLLNFTDVIRMGLDGRTMLFDEIQPVRFGNIKIRLV